MTAYLSGRLGVAVPDRVGTVVHEYIQGHVGGLELAATLLARAGTVDEATARRMFGARPDDPDRAWARLVRSITEQVRDPVLTDAVNAATVLRTFDQPLLGRLIGDEVAARAIRALLAHGLIRALDTGASRFRMLEFVRQALIDDLRTLHGSVWLDLHTRAAEYLFEEFGKDFDDADLSDRGFRFEQDNWQSKMRDWLYHSGQLPHRRQVTRARFALVFFEAFYWWGCFRRFDFNYDLVDDWERTVAVAQDDTAARLDRDLTSALRSLLQEFPPGLIKPLDGPWGRVEDLLLRIEDLCGVAPGAPLPKDPAAREQLTRLRGLLLLFESQALRYQDATDLAADEGIEEALELFDGLSDNWMVAWLSYEHAAVAVDRRDVPTAVTRLAQAARVHVAAILAADEDEDDDDEGAGDRDGAAATEPEWDYELIAELHRAAGDLAFAAGDWSTAGARYGRAVANAYWMQKRPHPPDAYTQPYFEDIAAAVTAGIRTLAERDGTAALAVAEAVRSALGPIAGTGPLDVALAAVPGGSDDPDPLRAALLPRGPEPSEIGEGDTAFSRAWNRHWARQPPRRDAVAGGGSRPTDPRRTDRRGRLTPGLFREVQPPAEPVVLPVAFGRVRIVGRCRAAPVGRPGRDVGDARDRVLVDALGGVQHVSAQGGRLAGAAKPGVVEQRAGDVQQIGIGSPQIAGRIEHVVLGQFVGGVTPPSGPDRRTPARAARPGPSRRRGRRAGRGRRPPSVRPAGSGRPVRWSTARPSASTRDRRAGRRARRATHAATDPSACTQSPAVGVHRKPVNGLRLPERRNFQ